MGQRSWAFRVEKAFQSLDPCQALNLETERNLTRKKRVGLSFKSFFPFFFFLFFPSLKTAETQHEIESLPQSLDPYLGIQSAAER